MLLNLTIGLLMMVVCLTVQCSVVGVMLRVLRGLERNRFFRPTMPRLIAILTISMLCLLFGNLLQVSGWALLFTIYGEFDQFETAFYHSLVNFTSLGYGDLVLSPKYRLLGALEAANGVMMLGLSTSVLIAVVNALFRRLRDHKTDDHPASESSH